MQKGCGGITYYVLFFKQAQAKQSGNCVANLGSLIQFVKEFPRFFLSPWQYP
jgi:hypothetical protein